ncbi:hypothetical protein CHS0354_040727 [Potamilus streckersoni]|uniref:Uncharacterized protein n=1 Tax=Potamilus streckersoni TaxID=2493646 RepID=A0AAE0VXQ1_9BIVA|nr:hypothetical protein CHS0354_040727 [Potamilus streckersoni]
MYVQLLLPAKKCSIRNLKQKDMGKVLLAVNEKEVAIALSKMKSMTGPVLHEIKVSKGGSKDLGGPTRTHLENKHDFMHFLAIN